MLLERLEDEGLVRTERGGHDLAPVRKAVDTNRSLAVS
jgi:hypothetical protein